MTETEMMMEYWRNESRREQAESQNNVDVDHKRKE